MTDDFDFDFDVDRGRSGSHTRDPEPGEPSAPQNRSGSNGHEGNGAGSDDRAAKRRSAEDDWLSFGDEHFVPGRRNPLREVTESHASAPSPTPPAGEGRSFAKEARRRAARRPSAPLGDLDFEGGDGGDGASEPKDVDFESVLEHQPQKGKVARRGSAFRGALRDGVEGLRRIGGERIAESRDRMSALREHLPNQLPNRIPQPRPADGGGGKPPPPRLPRRISSRRPRKPKPGKVKWLRLAIVLGGLGLLGIISTFFGMMTAISGDLPQLENKQQYAAAKNSEVFDDQGNKIGTLLSNNQRILVDSNQISPYMKEAAVAIEDRRFYEHRGVDIQGMARAAVADVLPGGSTQGASTITQQFVKNALEAQGDRTVFEKFREAALAYQIERHWDKDKILTEYLNTIYFGEGAYGIEAAARTYFGWNHPGCGESGQDPCAKELTPPEAAMLAGIISSPSAFSPRINPTAAKDRRDLVLQKMLDDGDISQAEYDGPGQGINTQLPVASEIEKPKDDSLSPYFTSWLRQQVVDLYGPGRAFSGGLDIRTSLDLDMQNTAQDIAESTLSGIGPTPSVVVLDNATGGVKAMVGGNDYENRPFNLATNGHRQPGSSFKPFTLATALTQGISPSATYRSNEKVFKVPNSKGKEFFDVNNYDDTYYGSSTLSDCTIHSDNSCYAEVALGKQIPCVQGCGGSPAVRGGTKAIARTAHRMGVETKFSTNPSMVLGAIDPGVTPLEMAHAFQTINTGGERVGGNLDSSVGPNNRPEDLSPVAIEKITGPDGKTVAENKPKKVRVLSSGVASTVKNILRENVLSGTGKLAQTGGFAWGKTGTTENNGDAWFCGGTERLTACVWVGYADSTQPMETEYGGNPVDGGTYPALIWGRIMGALENIYSEQKAEAASKGGDSSDSSSSSSDSYSSGYSGSSSSSGTSGSGGGGRTGGGGGGNTSAPAPPAGGGGGGGATGGTGGGTGGTGL